MPGRWAVHRIPNNFGSTEKSWPQVQAQNRNVSDLLRVNAIPPAGAQTFLDLQVVLRSEAQTLVPASRRLRMQPTCSTVKM